MILTLDTPKEVVIQKEITKTVSSVSIDSITDYPATRTVVAVLTTDDGSRKEVVLWEGAAYDNAGDWTQEEANDIILSLL